MSDIRIDTQALPLNSLMTLSKINTFKTQPPSKQAFNYRDPAEDHMFLLLVWKQRD